MSDNSEKVNDLKKILRNKLEIEEKLRCALEISNLGIWEWNLKTNIVILSDEIFDITGFDKRKFNNSMPQIIDEIIHDSSKIKFKNSINLASGKGIISNKTYRINNKEKKQCWVKVYSRLLLDENGDPFKIVGTLSDVTEEVLIKKDLSYNLRFFESLLEVLPNPIFYKDKDGKYKFCNKAFLDSLGFKREEIIGKGVYDIAPKNLADIYFNADNKLMNERGFQTYQSSVLYSDGTMHEVIFSKAVHEDPNGGLLGLVGIMQDITENRKYEKKLKMLYELKDVFLEINKEIYLYKNEEDFFTCIQNRLQKVFKKCKQSTVLKVNDNETVNILCSKGYVLDEVADFSMKLKESFIWTDTKGDFTKAHIIKNVPKYFTNEYRRVPKLISGETVYEALIIPIYIEERLKWIISLDSSEENAYTEIDRIVADYVSEELPIMYNLFSMHQKTLFCSRYDGLTKLMNRRYFDSILNDKINTGIKNGLKFAIVAFDLDQLKVVNDSFGHDAGDKYITLFSKMLKECLNYNNNIGRIGGDEFTAIVEFLDIDEIYNKIHDFQNEFSKKIIIKKKIKFSGSFSFGFAKFPEDSTSKEELVKIADQNMYMNKKRNRGKKIINEY
jgi:diguanylate cyclase (GGDEF)-like protein/PAS domain S-box-containing protein